MNQEETLALFQECEEAADAVLKKGGGKAEAQEVAKAVWNRWASEKQMEKAELQSRKLWRTESSEETDYYEVGANQHTKDWMTNATVDFGNVDFGSGERLSEICFRGFLFPGPVNFSGASFANAVSFEGACFFSGARFQQAEFRKTSSFVRTQFQGRARFSESVFLGEADFEGVQFKHHLSFKEARFQEAVNFQKAAFFEIAKFRKAEFHGRTDFSNATFSALVLFRDTRFLYRTYFENVMFEGQAYFRGAEFERRAYFNNSVFHQDVYFSEVQFKERFAFRAVTVYGDIEFVLSTFEGYSNLARAQFHQSVDFLAVHAKRAFNMKETNFINRIPNFDQANFVEAPRFDNVKVPVTGFWRSIFRTPEKSGVAKFRALRRLALNAHDHERERLFFKGEMRSKRGGEERFYQSQWWFSLIYDIFSDYGRSVVRPVLAWLAMIPLFGWFSTMLDDAKEGTCSAFDTTVSSIYLAAQNALIVFSATRGELMQKAYKCVYQGAGETAPDIPILLGPIGLVHSLLSAVMLFLMLLGLRNMFKIK